jgi:hypothetical protein
MTRLTKWLCGGEIAALEGQVDAWRGRALAAETTVELIKEVLKREQDLREKLQTELVTEMRPQSVKPPEMKPVGNTVSSWPRIRRELERRERVKEDAEVSREEIEKTIRSQE